MPTTLNNCVGIIAIGDELTSGQIIDTNSRYLSAELTALGFSVRRTAVVGDRFEDIVQELRSTGEVARLIFTTGGLGPTTDDLTRDSIASVANVALAEDPEALAKLERWSLERGRPLHAAAKRQALFPAGATVIVNPAGTADSFLTAIPIPHGDADSRPIQVIAFPGVPRELKAIFQTAIVPWIQEQYPHREKIAWTVRKFFGLSESHIGNQIEKLVDTTGVQVAYRPIFPEVWVRFTAKDSHSQTQAQARVETVATHVQKALGSDYIYSDASSSTLASTVGELLCAQNLRIAAAESCSGGALANTIVAVPGSSRWFIGSLVTYANEAKQLALGVRPSLLERYGAVSEPVAIAMAQGVLARMGADIAVSITGIAGPDGGTEQKPVGTVWFGLATKDDYYAFELQLRFEREQFRIFCAHYSLELVRRKILGLTLSWDRL